MNNRQFREITFLLQYFHPEVASTAQLMTELAENLVARGYRIRVLCGQPTYVQSKRLARREVYKGIEIERLPCTRFSKNSFWGRLLNWSSYTFFLFFRLFFSSRKAPLFIVSTPPFLFVAGFLLNIIRRQEYICLVYDLYPDIAEKLGYVRPGSIIPRFWHRCNKAFFRRAAAIIAPSERMGDLIKEKIGRGAGKIRVIHNWADGGVIRPLDKKSNPFAGEHGLVDKFVILYAGNIGLFHQLETIVEAANRLRDVKEIKFVFIGEGGKKTKLLELAKRWGLDNVLFLPYQDKEKLPQSLSCGDISVVSLEKGLDCVAAPCKLYTSLAAGQIILGLVDSDSDVARIIDRYECGFSASQDDVGKAVDIIRTLYDDPTLRDKLKENARRCFDENFTKEKAMDEYEEVLRYFIGESRLKTKGGWRWEMVKS